MVTVGNVGARNACEHRAQGVDGGGPVDAPYGLAQSLGVGEVVEWGCRCGGGDDGRERGVVAIGEKHRAGLAAGGGNVVCAVLLVDWSCELVPANGARLVVVHREGRHDARLLVAVAAQAVQVVAGVAVAHEGAVGNAVGKEARGLLVDVCGMHVVGGVEGGLWSVDGEERVRPLGHGLARLLPREHVIGQ